MSATLPKVDGFSSRRVSWPDCNRSPSLGVPGVLSLCPPRRRLVLGLSGTIDPAINCKSGIRELSGRTANGPYFVRPPGAKCDQAVLRRGNVGEVAVLPGPAAQPVQTQLSLAETFGFPPEIINSTEDPITVARSVGRHGVDVAAIERAVIVRDQLELDALQRERPRGKIRENLR